MLNGSHRTLFAAHVTTPLRAPPSSVPLPHSGPTAVTPSSSQPSSTLQEQETRHHASPRGSVSHFSQETNTSSSSIANTSDTKRNLLNDVVTMNVPRNFEQVVKTFIEAVQVLDQAESALADRAQRMLTRLATATPRDSSVAPAMTVELDRNEDESRTLSRNVSGVDLVNRDLEECAEQIKSLQETIKVFNEAGACRIECELVDQDVYELQQAATTQFAAMKALVEASVVSVMHRHNAAVLESKHTFTQARAAFTEHEETFGSRRQSLARDSIERLATMRRRMQRIQHRKKDEQLGVKARLDNQDPYDPETPSMQRKSTRIDDDLSKVACQLLRIDELKKSLETTLGGPDAVESIVGAEFISQLANTVDPPSRRSPTTAAEPTFTHAARAEQQPPVVTTGVSHLQPIGANTTALPRKRQRETSQFDYNDASDQSVRPASVRATQAPLLASAQLPQLHHHNNVADDPQHEIPSAGEVSQSRGGIIGFFKAVINRATTFPDECDEDEPPRHNAHVDPYLSTTSTLGSESDDDDESDATSSEYNV